VIKKVTTAIRDLYAEKGYEYAEIKPVIAEMPNGPKLVHLTFNITPGPKVQIGKVDFVGNKAFKDGVLEGQMKANKSKSWLSFITSAGTYQEAKFADDAERVVAFYRDHGYIFARVGTPQPKHPPTPHAMPASSASCAGTPRAAARARTASSIAGGPQA